MDNALPTLSETSDERQNQPDSQHNEQKSSKEPTPTVESTYKAGIKRKFEVCDHFDIIRNSKPKRVACQYCNKSYACESGRNGTSTMLTHWKERCKKAPHNKVAFEFAFSTRGRMLECFRSSLAPGTAEALICTQDWFKASMVDAL